ncbi:MAG: deoxyribodipyrimidine photo-lyase [Verrucomicrobiota bacterium]
MKRAVVWFRRDLRLSDNTALAQALRAADEVVPVFVLDPSILESKSTGSRRVAFLLGCLKSLQNNLEHIGSELILRYGDPAEVLPEVLQATDANEIHWNNDYEGYARKRDQAVRQACQQSEVSVNVHEDQCLCEPGSILKDDGAPYVVFTPFSRKWKDLYADQPRPRPGSLKKSWSLKGDPIPEPDDLGHGIRINLPETGEKAAKARLDQFIKDSIATYDQDRDFPDLDRTSRLSADLRFGSIGPRTVHAAAAKAYAKGGAVSRGAEIFISELIWRDFYKHILFHYPHVESGAFRQEYDALEWENDKELFQAWCEGRTGFPIVDAAMRQLNSTGWMHNRLRMIVASFLTKDLLIDWRWGERYFMDKLLDGDLAANNGGWQWAAGTGTDAQPYFRIFNPYSQAKKFDPEGKFIEKWVGETDPSTYHPIVDHSIQRQKALALYKKLKN